MRIIDADALKQKYTMATTRYSGGIMERPVVVLEAIDDAPSIDIVRCGECRYAHMTYDGQCKYCDQITDDDGNVIEVYYDGSHFCSDGEREGE